MTGNRSVKRPVSKCHGRRAVATLVGLAAIFGGGLVSMGPASAAGSDPVASTATTGSATVLNLVDVMTANGTNSVASTTVAVPVGLHPVAVTGLVTIGHPGAQGASITLGNRVVANFPTAQGGTVHAVVQPSDVTAGQLVVSVHSGPPVNPNICAVTPAPTVTLSRVRVDFAGIASVPTTIGNFFNGGIYGVSVNVTKNASDDASQAALAAAGSLSNRFGSNTPVILTTGPESSSGADAVTTARPGYRIVNIRSTSAAVITASPSADSVGQVKATVNLLSGIPTLTLIGSGQALTDAASALSSPSIAVAGAATVTGLTNPISNPTSLTLSMADLGNDFPTVSGFGLSQSYTKVSQSAFGGPISSATLVLQGHHTAIPAQVAATLSVLWNNHLVASQLLGNDGDLALTANIPASYISRDNGLVIQLQAVPQQGNCSQQGIPPEVDIVGAASVITAQRGQSLQDGFNRVPQTLGGALPIAFGTTLSHDDALLAASQLVAAIQRLAPTQLAISVVPVAAITNASTTGLLVGANGDDTTALSAPLRLAQFRQISATGGVFGVGVGKPFAALEVFSNHSQQVILLGSYSPSGSGIDAASTALQLSLARAAGDGSPGWAALPNDLLVAQQGEQIASVSSDAVVPQTEVTTEYRHIPTWVYLLIGVVLFLALTRYYQLRRLHKAKLFVDAQQGTTGEPEGNYVETPGPVVEGETPPASQD
jgi:hypothetical protein